jgi:hypothetical protein
MPHEVRGEQPKPPSRVAQNGDYTVRLYVTYITICRRWPRFGMSFKGGTMKNSKLKNLAGDLDLNFWGGMLRLTLVVFFFER